MINRFQAGFLSRKSGVSPSPPSITNLSSSDTDPSPLRTIDPGKLANRSSMHIMQVASSDTTPTDSGNNSSSEGENWPIDRSESAKISFALKRNGSVSRQSSHGYSMSDSVTRTQRRRSPTAATITSSPPNENSMFTASHARRMVNSQKEPIFSSSVLSPRTAPVVKSSIRRTTIGDGRQVGSMSSHAIRLSSAMGGTPRSRDSVAGVMGKGGWR
jgi:kinesin family member 18/19